MKQDIKDLLKEEKAILKQLKDVNKRISKYRDGHIYVVVTYVYGHISVNRFNNKIKALELCHEYYGDNGIADLYTSNRRIKWNHNPEGSVIYIKSFKDLEEDENIKDKLAGRKSYIDYKKSFKH